MVGLRVEVDHVAGFLGGLRAGVHRDGHVRLGERGRVVGAVARHRDEVSPRLVVADQRELRLGRGFGEEVVDAGFGRDRRRRERVVARDHDGLDAHLAQLAEALADAALDDVLQLDDAEHAGRRPRRRAACRPRVAIASTSARTSFGRRRRPRPRRSARSRRRRPCGSRRPSRSTPLMRVCALNGHERRAERVHVALAQAELLLRQHHDAAAFRRLVRERGELGGVGEVALGDAGRRDEGRRLAVAERDRAGLVEQQHVHVAGGLDRAAGRRDHVRLDHAVHAGDADRGEQAADRRRDQADEERDEHRDRSPARPARGR